MIAIGKALRLSPPFPLLHTVHATFIAHGIPSFANYFIFPNVKVLRYQLIPVVCSAFSVAPHSNSTVQDIYGLCRSR